MAILKRAEMKGLCVVAIALCLNLVGMLTQREVILLCSYFKGSPWNVAHSPRTSPNLPVNSLDHFFLSINVKSTQLPRRKKKTGFKTIQKFHKVYKGNIKSRFYN